MRIFGHTSAAQDPAAPSSSTSMRSARPVRPKPGSYLIADNITNRLIGTRMLDRRPADRPGHLAVLRRGAWGIGLAFEAATAALRAAADELPDQPVVVVTQTANRRSLKLAARFGFHNVDTFEEFGAQQTLATARLHSFKA
jgi:RimJ/RimL family protein N-acetyltransferase